MSTVLLPRFVDPGVNEFRWHAHKAQLTSWLLLKLIPIPDAIYCIIHKYLCIGIIWDSSNRLPPAGYSANHRRAPNPATPQRPAHLQRVSSTSSTTSMESSYGHAPSYNHAPSHNNNYGGRDAYSNGWVIDAALTNRLFLVLH